MRDDLEALEAELIEKFKRLDLATKQRLMAQVEDVTPSPTDFDVWLQKVEAFEKRLAPQVPFLDAVEAVRQIREEDDDDIRGG